MYRLSASVGQNGVNKHDDVLIVQTLLNKNAHIVETIGRSPAGKVDYKGLKALAAERLGR